MLVRINFTYLVKVHDHVLTFHLVSLQAKLGLVRKLKLYGKQTLQKPAIFMLNLASTYL